MKYTHHHDPIGFSYHQLIKTKTLLTMIENFMTEDGAMTHGHYIVYRDRGQENVYSSTLPYQCLLPCGCTHSKTIPNC